MATSNEELLRALNFNANPTYRYVPIWIRRYRYAIEEIFTSANMIITEFDK